MMDQLQFEEIKDNLNYDLYELFDDYVEDIRLTIMNEDNIVIAIYDIDDDTYNSMQLSKTNFSDLEYQAFEKILHGLIFYAQ